MFLIAIPVTYFLHESRKKKEASKTDLSDSTNNGIVNSIASKE